MKVKGPDNSEWDLVVLDRVSAWSAPVATKVYLQHEEHTVAVRHYNHIPHCAHCSRIIPKNVMDRWQQLVNILLPEDQRYGVKGYW